MHHGWYISIQANIGHCNACRTTLILRTDDTFLNFRSFFVKICVLFACIPSCFQKKKKKNWGYLTRPNLELAIVIICGCCKEMVYQYVVVTKRSKQSQPITGCEHGAFTVVFRYPNHYAIEDHISPNVKLIQYLTKNSSNGGGRKNFF
jgi:hypothetical protein